MEAKTIKLILNQMPDDYIRLLNTFFDFSPREIEILSQLIRNNADQIDEDSRQKTIEKLGISNLYLNSYIKRIKDKGGILDKQGVLAFNSILVPNGNQITFTWDEP